MNYTQKSKELRVITREIRLLNPNTRSRQLMDDRCLENIKKAAEGLKNNTIHPFEAFGIIVGNFIEMQQPVFPSERFKSGGICIKQDHSPYIEPVEWVYCEPKTPFNL